MRSSRYASAAAALLVALLAAACGSGRGGSAEGGSAASSTPVATAASPAPSSPSATSATTSSGPLQTAMGKRCGPPDVEATMATVEGADDARLAIASVGTGGTVALLLHQTGRSASCGWWPFANRLAQNGVRAVMLDFCGYGRSTCDTSKPSAADYVDQVVRTTKQLRADGATRVTIVGASLGGTVASLCATPAGADAIASLSGGDFGPYVTGPAMAAIAVPLLGAGSHAEQSDGDRLSAQVSGSVSPTKRFVWSEAGHGWSLVVDGPQVDAPLSAIGRTVIGWVTGDYAA